MKRIKDFFQNYRFKSRLLILILVIGLFLFLSLALFQIFGLIIKDDIFAVYQARESERWEDRQGRMITLKENEETYYCEHLDAVPERLAYLLVEKEDRFFYHHPGINPFSVLRALWQNWRGRKGFSSSTITQQLVKILFNNEFERSWTNKIKESFFALSLETVFSKEEILAMYADSIYFGNRAEGIGTASRLYFGKTPAELSDQEILQLLATISNPSNNNPFAISNSDATEALYARLRIRAGDNEALNNKDQLQKEFQEYLRDGDYFELEALNTGKGNRRLSVDLGLTDKLREILKNNLNSLADKEVVNGAIVVLSVGEKNELLSIVGSPDPKVDAYGYRINMAVRPRSIGSTIKPFIYFKGFEKGLRPYTRVEDREYKYIIDSGFAFYPKNYDYEYRGEVDLHYALANSLNVPTVKVLEYFGLEDFYSFLSDDLSFTPVQPLPNYQLGIALGELEMDLLSLSYYFSILANSGYLQPLEICQSGDCSFPVLANLDVDKKIVDEKYIQLVNKILSDRQTGVEQFGIRSDLNLLFGNYAVKTGTSREFHDSWTIGYTPDFIVGVWVGNSDERPMNNVSGSAGAGRIWQEAMNLLYNSEYNHRNSFDFSKIKEFSIDGNLVFGLLEDDFTDAYSKLLGNNLMLEPHDGDVFLLEKNTQILLKARSTVSWLINGAPLAGGEEAIFYPQVAGRYEIKAVSPNGVEEIISIIINETE